MDRVFSGRRPCQIAAKDTWGDDELTSKSKVDLARLPPCYSTLKPHIQRVNHRVALYKRADEAIVDKTKHYDEGQGWLKNKGVLMPVWSCSPVPPTSLVDLYLSIYLHSCLWQEVQKSRGENQQVYEQFLSQKNIRTLNVFHILPPNTNRGH